MQDKKIIKKLLHRKEASLVDMQMVNTKFYSNVWKRFKAVEIHDPEAIATKEATIEGKSIHLVEKFVACESCLSLFTYEPSKGTSHMNKHKCYNPANQQTRITNFTEASKRKVPEQDQQRLNCAIVRFIATSLRPYSIMDDPGLRNLLQEYGALCAKYGNINVDQVVRKRRASKELIHQRYQEIVGTLRDELTEVYGVGYTSDVWTEPITSTKYVSLTLHYVDVKKIKLTTRIIACEAITGTCISSLTNWFDETRRLYKIQDKKYLMTTDNGSNMITAFNSDFQIRCLCHNLNLVVQYFFSSEIIESVHITELISKCKAMVTYCKKASIQSQLDTSLKQSIATRWNSELTMFNSILDNYETLKELFWKNSEARYLLSDEELSLMTDMCSILRKFEDATTFFSASTYPTINSVVNWHDQLLKWCAPSPSDTDLARHMKSELRQQIGLRWTSRLSDFHYVGLLLDPRYRSLSFLDDSKIDKTIDSLANHLSELNTSRG